MTIEDEDLATQEASDSPTMDDTILAGLEKFQIGDDPVIAPTVKIRERDETGKFAKKEDKVVDDGDDKTPSIDNTESTDPVTDPVTPEDKAPSSLRKEIQEKWKTLDPVIRDEFKKREEDFHKGIEIYRAHAQESQTWQQTVAPFMQTINGFGVTPQVAAENLFKADHVLRYGNPQQKMAMVQKIFTDYQIDPSMLQAQQDNPLSPVLQQLQSMEQRLAQRERQEALQAQYRDQELVNQANAEIQKFIGDKEHFETVREDMALLLETGRANDLKDAYEQAVWLNPTTRASMIAKQQSDMKVESIRKAQEAKKSASVNVKKAGTLPPKAGAASSMDETILEGMDKLGIFSR